MLGTIREKLYFARLGQAVVTRLRAHGIDPRYKLHISMPGPAAAVSIAFGKRTFEMDVEDGETATVAVLRLFNQLVEDGKLPKGFDDCIISPERAMAIARAVGAH